MCLRHVFLCCCPILFELLVTHFYVQQFVIHTQTFTWCGFQALIDGPCTGVLRQDINFKALHLTKLLINIGHSARSGTVRKAWESSEISKKWAETKWAKKKVAQARVSKLAIVMKNVIFSALT